MQFYDENITVKISAMVSVYPWVQASLQEPEQNTLFRANPGLRYMPAANTAPVKYVYLLLVRLTYSKKSSEEQTGTLIMHFERVLRENKFSNIIVLLKSIVNQFNKTFMSC